MKDISEIKAIELKTLVISIIITLLVFLISGNAVINRIEGLHYGHVKEESLNFARNYSQSFTKVKEANDIINRLLEEKLLVASKTVTLYEGEYSNELLADMAKNLGVDVIYYYSPQGEIIYSNDGTYIGWKAYENHPVYEFMTGDDISLVEDIRKDSDSETYYKYGYFKEPDGGFVQIGVLAGKIQSFLDSFDIQELLNDLHKTENAIQINFIDNDYNIIGSTDKLLIGTVITDHEVREGIYENKEYINLGIIYGEEVYEVYVPVHVNDHQIGILHVAQPLKDTQELIDWVKMSNIISLIVIFAILIYMILSTYKKNKQLIKLAYFDFLTGLPNREFLIKYLRNAIRKNKNIKKAILLINCINFRTINLVSGYRYGDSVIQEMANRLTKLLGSNNKLFRFIDDRFIMYVENYMNQDDLVTLSKEISDEFNKPLGNKEHIEVKVGIVEINEKYDKVDDVLKDATIALSHINGNDVNYIFFNEEMEKLLRRETLIERELWTALYENNTNLLYLEYQPQIDLKNNKIIGFEALVRMRTESLGFVSPVEFIDIAERKQLIVPLGMLIMEIACDFIGRLRDEGYDDIKVSVNVSSIQLLQDDFTKSVMDIIEKRGIRQSNLELEITESILMENFGIINKKLEELRKYGIKISLDDFGTGYSSFSRLRELNLDYIKIDKFFTDKITTGKNGELIIGDIISMSHKIGLAVVAEGVEVEEQRKYLKEHNCDIIQGYLFSKPLSEEDAIQLLNNANKY